jgi:hypothetical protein
MHVSELLESSNRTKETLASFDKAQKNLNESLKDGFNALAKTFPLSEARIIGRNEYAGFVWDQPTSGGRIEVTFPDGRTTTVTSQADARRVADDWLARSRAAAAPSSNTPDNDGNGSRRTPDADTPRETMRQGFLRRFRRAASPMAAFRRGWMYSLAAAIGLTIDHEDRYEEQLQEYWLAAQAGELVAFPNGKESLDDLTLQEAEDHLQANTDRYEQIVARAYGLLAAAYYGSIMTALIGPLWRGGKATVGIIRGGRYLRRFIQWAKGLRVAATAIAAGVGAAAGAGVGGIVTGLISFVLGSAAIWAVELVLTRTNAGPTVVAWIVNWTLREDIDGALEVYGMNVNDWSGRVLEYAADQGDVALNVVANAAADLTSDELQRDLRDARRELLANPRASEVDRRAANVLAEPGDTTSQPAASPSAAPAQTQGANPALFPSN